VPTLALDCSQKSLIIGPIYDRLPLLSIDELIKQYDYIVFNSGLILNNSNVQQMQNLMTNKKIFYIVGRSDYLFLKENPDHSISKWIKQLPNIIMIHFLSRTIIIMDGGIPYKLTKKELLSDNLEASFISNYKKQPWHLTYNGELGYVISNNPLTNKYPQHYNYSMQIGNINNGVIYGQEVDDIGLKQLIKWQ
jgi:hypothetical protein